MLGHRNLFKRISFHQNSRKNRFLNKGLPISFEIMYLAERSTFSSDFEIY